jgi:uncharacterized integral membrane protein
MADESKPTPEKTSEPPRDREPTPPRAPQQPEKGRGGVSATLILGILLPLLVIILAAQNTNEVKFEFLFWDVRSPLVVVILGSALAGLVISQIAALLWRRRQRASRR